MIGSERGSALVELVLVVTLLFSFLFAVIDFALIEASDNAGSNAAREGARQAILNPTCADLHAGCANPSTALQAITTRAQSRLGGLVAGTPQVTVICWDGSATQTIKNCDSATLVPGVDLVEVDVTWKRLATSPYATVSTHTDKATMTIQGSGQGTHSTSCQVVTSSVAPSQAQINSGTNGALTGPVTITAQTNGLCQPLYISFSTGSTPDQSTPVAMTLNGTDIYSYTIGAAQYNWTPGSYNLNLSELGTYQVNPAPAPVLTVTSTTCTISAASVNPSAVVLSGASPSGLAQSVSLSVTTTSACTAINAVFDTDGSGSRTVAMTGSAPNWTLAIAAGAYSWTAGAKQFAFTNPVTSPATALQTPSSVILQVAARCALTVSLNPSSITLTSNGASSPVVITATPTASADCSGLTVTYQYAKHGFVTVSMGSLDDGAYKYTIPQSTGWTKGSWSMTFSSTSTSTVSTDKNPVQVAVK